jgi:hypothetical protein
MRSDIFFDITTSKDFLLPIRSLKLGRKADDESVPVRHLYFRQRLRIHLIGLADEFVERQNIRGQSVDLIVGESLWLLPFPATTSRAFLALIDCLASFP